MKKIAIYNGFPFHYEMFGYIIDYCLTKNYTLDIYTITENNCEWLKFYLYKFPKAFKYVNITKFDENRISYDRIVLITSYDPYFKNDWINDKVITIFHSSKPFVITIGDMEINVRKQGSKELGTRFFVDNPIMKWSLPVYKILDITKKESKPNVLCVGKNALDPNIINLFPDFNKYNFVFISKNVQFENKYKNITYYSNLSTFDMLHLYIESDYAFITSTIEEHIDKSMSGSIPLALNCLCTLIMPERMNKHYKFKSAITYNDKIVLREPDYKLVEEDFNDMINHRNNVFDEYF